MVSHSPRRAQHLLTLSIFGSSRMVILTCSSFRDGDTGPTCPSAVPPDGKGAEVRGGPGRWGLSPMGEGHVVRGEVRGELLVEL